MTMIASVAAAYTMKPARSSPQASGMATAVPHVPGAIGRKPAPNAVAISVARSGGRPPGKEVRVSRSGLDARKTAAHRRVRHEAVPADDRRAPRGGQALIFRAGRRARRRYDRVVPLRASLLLALVVAVPSVAPAKQD